MKELFTLDGIPVPEELKEIARAKCIADAKAMETERTSPRVEVEKLHRIIAEQAVRNAVEKMGRRLEQIMDELKYIPARIIKSGPATIVFWADGTKTVVKCGEDTIPDDYAAFCAALGKKVFGSNSALKRAMFNAMDEEKKDMEDEPGGSA